MGTRRVPGEGERFAAAQKQEGCGKRDSTHLMSPSEVFGSNGKCGFLVRDAVTVVLRLGRTPCRGFPGQARAVCVHQSSLA